MHDYLVFSCKRERRDKHGRCERVSEKEQKGTGEMKGGKTLCKRLEKETKDVGQLPSSVRSY